VNFFVCIKQVPDTETKIKIKPDQSGIDFTGVKWIVSPYDEIALEEAIRAKEKNPGSTVTVLSAGPVRVTEGLRKGLAMGADLAIHVDIPDSADSFLTAQALSAAIKKHGSADIVFAGKEAIDDGASQVSQLVASFLDLPSAAVVIGIQYEAGSCICKREVEGGTSEMVKMQLPCVISVSKGLNDPRYPNVQNMMAARKKEVKTYTLADLGLNEKDHQKIRFVQFELPAPKAAARKITGDAAAQVKELVHLLHQEAKVI
jgi:electron transfer flavoprotein beta subunit